MQNQMSPLFEMELQKQAWTQGVGLPVSSTEASEQVLAFRKGPLEVFP